MQKPHWTAPSSRKACWSGRQRPSGRQALDGRDLAAVRLDRQDEAGVDDAAVQADRAGAALAHEAALLRAGQLEVVAEHVEQRVMRGDLEARDGAR